MCLSGRGKTFSCIFPESVLYYRGACRCVGIGRRGGLKIHWANPPCGFDPRHRHHICSEVSCFGAFFTAQKQNIEHFSETPEELHMQTRPYWKIQMCVNIGSDADVAVPQPFLNLLQAHTIGIEQTGTAMPLRYTYDKPEKHRISRVVGLWQGFSSFFKPENRAAK